jgi:hypothetical protein
VQRLPCVLEGLFAPFACILSNFAPRGDKRTRENQLPSDQEISIKTATASAIARSMKVPADGKVGQDAFVVIRQVIQQTNLVAFAPIVLTSHHIALEPRGKGIMGTLL